MSTLHESVFLFDVDNTLLDNDAVTHDLHEYLRREFGAEECDYYWKIFEQLRIEVGYADYLGALQRYRLRHMHDPQLLHMSSFLIDYPFHERLYPGAIEVLQRYRQWGPVVILSDGDVVFQPHKIARSGLAKEVDGVLVYIHKERELLDVEQRFPAQHYFVIDDKLRILTSIKRSWKDSATTVFPRQGHYATDPAVLAEYPPADVSIATINQLLEFDPLTLAPTCHQDAAPKTT